MPWSDVPHEDVLRHAPFAVALVSGEGRLIAWNDRAEAVTGFRAQDVVGRADPGLVDQDATERIRAAVRSGGGSLSQGRSVVTRRRADGALQQLAIHAVHPVELGDGAGVAVWFDVATDAEVLVARRHRLSHDLVEAQRPDDVDAALASALPSLLSATRAVVLRRCPGGAHLHGIRAVGDLTDTAEGVQLDLGGDEAWDRALVGTAATAEVDLLGGRVATRFVPMGPNGSGWVFAVLGEGDDATPGAAIARAVADEAWIALQRSALVAELEGKVEVLEATHTLAGSVGLELEEAVEAVARRSASALACERAAVYLVGDSGAPVLAHVHVAGTSPQTVLSDGEGLAFARLVADSRSPQLFQDVTACEAADGPWHGDQGAVSVLGHPLVIGDRLLGVLVVAHTVAAPRGFTSLCQQVAAAVVQQGAIAVEHALLYRQERESTERLRELDRVRADWFAGVTHDLRTPLTGLVGFVRTLQRLGHVVTDEERDQYLAVMARQADRLVLLVEDMLVTAELDASAPLRRSETLDLAVVAAGCIGMLAEEDRARVESSTGSRPRSVLGDPTHLARIVQNLLGNALQHAERVEATVEGRGDVVVLVVEDDGPGIAPDQRQRVFDRYDHGGEDASTGLGLFVARGLARAHGGEVEVTGSERLGGARFVLTLPAAGSVPETAEQRDPSDAGVDHG